MLHAKSYGRLHRRVAACLVIAIAGVVFGRMLVLRQGSATSERVVEDSASFAANGPKSQDASETVVDSIPIRLLPSNNLAIQGILNRTSPLTFMFHLAEDSVVLTSAAAAKESSLKYETSVEVKSWGGSSTSQRSTGNRLEIGAQCREGLEIFIDELSGPGTDGKIGPSFFEQPVIELDLDRSMLVLHSAIPRFALDATHPFQRVEVRSKSGALYADGRLVIGGESWKHSFMLHTGFTGTLLLDDSFVKEHDILSQLETVSVRELRDSFGNIIQTRKVLLPKLEFGGQTYTNLPIEYFLGEVGIQKTSIIGCDLLFRNRILLDKEQFALYLTPRRDTP